MGSSAPNMIRAITGLFLAFTYLSVGLRCYVRLVVVKSFAGEDWFAVASLAAWTIYAVSSILGAANSAGEHMVDIDAQIRAEGLLGGYAKVSYTASSALLKFSVGWMLLHFVAKSAQRIWIWIILVLVFVYSTTFFFFIIFQCNPPSFFWADQIGQTGTCLPPNAVGIFSIVYSIINAIADLYFAIVPCFVVRNLQMPRRTKTYVSGILGVGALAGCAVIIRVPYLLILLHNYLDFLYYSTSVVNWSTVELGLGITAAALSTLRPLFRTLKHEIYDYSNSKTNGTGSRFGGSKARANSAGYIESSAGGDIRMNTIREGTHSRPDDIEAVSIMSPKSERTSGSKAELVKTQEQMAGGKV